MHILGARGVLFGSLVSQPPFWELWGLLGHLFGGLGRLRLHFGGSGGPLGLVLAPLGILWGGVSGLLDLFGSLLGAQGPPKIRHALVAPGVLKVLNIL